MVSTKTVKFYDHLVFFFKLRILFVKGLLV